LTLSALLAACGDSVEAPLAPIPPLPPNPDTTLNGTFQATFNSFSDLVLLQGTLQLFLSESSSGTLSGGYVIVGTIEDGSTKEDVAGGGALTGVVSAGGESAPLSFTAVSDYCGHSSDFVGVYLRKTGVLGIEGAVDVLDDSCGVWRSFPLSVALGR
jgi:hypothetical protein